MAIHISMPKLSDTMTEGTLIKWHKKVGDTVEMGDILAEVETDKATMEMESFDEGTIYKLLVEEGGTAKVGADVAILLTEGEEAPAEGVLPATEKAEKTVVKKEVPNPAEKAADVSEVQKKESSVAKAENGRVKASPLARKIAEEKGISLSGMEGSGPGGRIVAADIESLKSPSSAIADKPVAKPIPVSAAAGEERSIPLSGMRKVIAQRLFESKTQIPHFYLNIEVNAEPLLALRAQLKTAGEIVGIEKLTINDFVLRATALAAARVPRINATFTEEAIIEYGSVNLAVAVALEDGLITPVIRNAQQKSLSEISTEMKDLATRARSKKLKPEEYQGGTISVSNLGAYGIDSFYAILNPPQAAILAIGGIVKKPVVNANGEIVVGSVMNIGISGDHRVADGAVAATFLAEFRKLLENPSVLLA